MSGRLDRDRVMPRVRVSCHSGARGGGGPGGVSLSCYPLLSIIIHGWDVDVWKIHV